MFLSSRLLSGPRRSGLLLIGLIFLVGLAIGASLNPAPTPVRTDISSDVREMIVTRRTYQADVLRVIDGDTFEARIHVSPGHDITTRVRLRGIDAAEMKAQCLDELVQADAARAALKAILDQGEVTIGHVALDKYAGRVVADAATSRTGDVSAALLKSQHARPYNGGRREGWCR